MQTQRLYNQYVTTGVWSNNNDTMYIIFHKLTSRVFVWLTVSHPKDSSHDDDDEQHERTNMTLAHPVDVVSSAFWYTFVRGWRWRTVEAP